MAKEDTQSVLETIKGLKKVDPKELEEFKKAMTEEVIPEIVKIVEKRRLLAVESRHRQLKC